MFIVIIALGTTDLLFALDSIPAIYGLTQEPYLVLTANIFALMGLRQLYFLIGGLLQRLVYLSYGLAFLLGFIGVKLILHAMHENELPFINGGEPIAWAPDIPILVSLGVILGHPRGHHGGQPDRLQPWRGDQQPAGRRDGVRGRRREDGRAPGHDRPQRGDRPRAAHRGRRPRPDPRRPPAVRGAAPRRCATAAPTGTPSARPSPRCTSRTPRPRSTGSTRRCAAGTPSTSTRPSTARRSTRRATRRCSRCSRPSRSRARPSTTWSRSWPARSTTTSPRRS